MGYLVFGAIALVSSGYIIWKSSFAELRLQLPWFNFPIFIGEILLAFCLLFLFVTIFRSGWRLSREGWAWVGYGLFVFWKALSGYFFWGPLALRDAALFYYPLFALIGFTFWREDDWKPWIRRLALVDIFLITYFHIYTAFWPFSLIILALILAWQESHVVLRTLLTVMILLFAPFHKLFPQERTVVVASSAALIFIVLALTFCFWSKWRTRLMAGVCGFIIVLALILKMTDPGLWHTMDPRMAGTLPPPVDAQCEVKDKKALRLFEADGTTAYQNVNTLERFLHNLNMDISALGIQRGPVPRPLKGKKLDTVPSPADSVPAKSAPSIAQTPLPVAAPASVKAPTMVSSQTSFGTVQGSAVRSHSQTRDPIISIANSQFRLFIWRDMEREYLEYKPLFGFDFGRPLRSPSVQKYAYSTVQAEDGWIGAHNSFFYMVYKGGVVGLAVIIFVFVFWLLLARDFVVMKDLAGVLLCAVLFNWLVAANFFLIFELPYTAIPVWTLFGIAAKYRVEMKRKIRTTSSS